MKREWKIEKFLETDLEQLPSSDFEKWFHAIQKKTCEILYFTSWISPYYVFDVYRETIRKNKSAEKFGIKNNFF